VDQEVGGSNPPSCTNVISNLAKRASKVPTDRGNRRGNIRKGAKCRRLGPRTDSDQATAAALNSYFDLERPIFVLPRLLDPF
jgi:hypothetical protein